jgi:hypothetical protein
MAGRTLEWLTQNRLNPARHKFEHLILGHLILGHLTLIMILENEGIRFDAICETEHTTIIWISIYSLYVYDTHLRMQREYLPLLNLAERAQPGPSSSGYRRLDTADNVKYDSSTQD